MSILDEIWYKLMDLEMTLHERIDNANATFAHKIQDMLHEFIESAELYFVEISEAEAEFSDRLHELTTNYLSQKSINDDIRPDLKKVRSLSLVIMKIREFIINTSFFST